MANNLEVVVGPRVRSLRTSAQLSQRQLAEKFGAGIGKEIDATAITRMEQGNRPITITEAAVLAAIFDVGLTDLLRTDDEIDRRLRLKVAYRRVSDLTRELREAEVHVSNLEAPPGPRRQATFIRGYLPADDPDVLSYHHEGCAVAHRTPEARQRCAGA